MSSISKHNSEGGTDQNTCFHPENNDPGSMEATKCSRRIIEEVKISAPGKVILHGEHSVVYGKLALAASLSLRTHLSLKTIDNQSSPKSLILNYSDINFSLTIPLEEALKIILPNGIPLKHDPNQQNLFLYKTPDYIDHETLTSNIEQYLKQMHNSIKNQVIFNAVVISLYLYLSMVYPLSLNSQIPLTSLSITIQSEIKVSAGMGSSASFAVCLAAGFLQFIKLHHCQENSLVFSMEEKQLISQWAYQGEKVTHGNPSGIDNSVCTFGSIVKFRKGHPPESLKSILGSFQLKALLIDTNIPKDTKAQVQKVAKFKEESPMLVDIILNSMEEIAANVINIFQVMNDSSSEKCLGDCFALYNSMVDQNQKHLQLLGVSIPEIDRICKYLQRYGLNAKITGAGGGGFILCLVPDHFKKETLIEVEKSLEIQGYKCKFLELGGEGVAIN